MSDNTSIEWTEATWNPIRARDSAGTVGWHCERVSPGCQHCYAERLNEQRFGTGLPYNRRSRDLVEVYLDEKALTQPLHWRRPRRIFVCSMTDLFGEWVPDEMIDRVFAVMALSPQHTFQVLTKRPERMRSYVTDDDCEYESRADAIGDAMEAMSGRPVSGDPADDSYDALPWPLPNVWLGVSAEDQERADQRIPELLATPAAVRFVSCEPLLGPVDLMRISTGAMTETDALLGWLTTYHDYKPAPGQPPMGSGNCEARSNPEHRISWVIVGGESGPGARPCNEDWIRGIVQQCQSVRVPVFVKQGSGPRPGMPTGDPELDGLKEYPNGHA